MEPLARRYGPEVPIGAGTLLDPEIDGGIDEPMPHIDLACVYAIRGDKDASFRWLERAFDAGWRGYPVAAANPLFDPIRGDERFVRLIARIDADVAAMRKRAGL